MNAPLAWWLWFLPLGATAILTVCPRACRRTSAGVAIGAAVLSFALSLALFWTSAPAAVVESSVSWLQVGPLRVDLGLLLDPLSRLLLLVVTGVAGVIEIYSWGYLRDERGLTRYYAGLSFFLFAMLGVILAPNFIQMFATWELVGVSSWWLIGFWYDRPAAADAAKKAILTNRIGDAGFFLGILLIWATLGTVHFGELRAQLAANPHALWNLTTLAALLVFCGVLAKSAQFPLHVWLPDAMEVPPP